MAIEGATGRNLREPNPGFPADSGHYRGFSIGRGFNYESISGRNPPTLAYNSSADATQIQRFFGSYRTTRTPKSAAYGTRMAHEPSARLDRTTKRRCNRERLEKSIDTPSCVCRCIRNPTPSDFRTVLPPGTRLLVRQRRERREVSYVLATT